MKRIQLVLPALLLGMALLTPPTASANRSPVANAGVDQRVECPVTRVTLNGGRSSDPDGDALTYEWREGSVIVGRAASIVVAPSMGAHTYTLTVSDGKGGTASDDVVVTRFDGTPPRISVSLSPRSLWPPNHRMVDVVARVTVADNCTPVSGLQWSLTSITSNEPDNGLGDGDTGGDIQNAAIGTQDRAFSLRAERSGTGSGRVYTVTYTVRDASGNASVGSATVTVAHDQSYRSESRRETNAETGGSGKSKGKKGKKGKR
jgi:hypothetical protein